MRHDEVKDGLAQFAMDGQGFVVTKRAINNRESRREQQHDQHEVATDKARHNANARGHL
ncbi:unannotated protein [freshwater metagenome]|uniref:Unannotated protein n=1 Tax=freshwater metagenome TaxID=449393 RepID=A0A6J7GHI8_9ZZZZ